MKNGNDWHKNLGDAPQHSSVVLSWSFSFSVPLSLKGETKCWRRDSVFIPLPHWTETTAHTDSSPSFLPSFNPSSNQMASFACVVTSATLQKEFFNLTQKKKTWVSWVGGWKKGIRIWFLCPFQDWQIVALFSHHYLLCW